MTALLLTLPTLWAKESSKEAAKAPVKKDSEKVQSGIVVDETLQKLLDVKGVKPLYDECVKTKSMEDLPNCLWDKVKGNPQLKKAVQETYASETKKEVKKDAADATSTPSRKPASEDTALIAQQNVVAVNLDTDPAVEALSKFYKSKLDAVLDPAKALTAEEQKNGTILATDHRQFIDLYKSSLGKTIVNALTSYCIETNPSSCDCTAAEVATCSEDPNKCKCQNETCSISDDPKEREEHRKANLASLKNVDLNSKSPASLKWQRCITTVTSYCGANAPTDESKKRSCLIMDYVESARKNIMYADKQKDFYDELGKTRTANILVNTKAITDKNKNSSDALLEITSADIEKALKDPTTKASKEFEECYKDGQIVNAEACKKYLNTNVEENSAALAELGMRYNAQEEILTEELKKDDEKVKSYLKEEGYNENQIAEMTKDPVNLDKVREEILKRYKDQKEAIIKDMAEKIKNKTATAEGKIDANDASKLDKIKNEMNGRTTDLQGLVKFNNIVSSYLEVKPTGSNSKEAAGRNTASIFAEANSMKEEDKKALMDQINQAKLSDQKGSANTINLDVESINQMMKYEAEKDLERKKNQK